MNFSLLANHELDVLNQLISGKDCQEIAGDLNVTLKTIRKYTGNINKKLNGEGICRVIGTYHELNGYQKVTLPSDIRNMIMEQVAKGYSNKETASSLGITAEEVRSRVYYFQRKWGPKNRRDLILQWIKYHNPDYEIRPLEYFIDQGRTVI